MNSKKYFLFVGYVVLALLIRQEFHPFSCFPMYNHFPNWAYSFYLQNERGEMVPFKKYFSANKGAGVTAHNFYSLFNHHNWMYGYGKEDTLQMQQAGKELLATIIKNEPVEQIGCDTLALYRRYYYLDNNQLKYRDDLMYAERIGK